MGLAAAFGVARTDEREAVMSAYGAGQIFGVLILVLVVVGVVREVLKKRGGGDGEG